jgi:hypothetical protein
MPQATRARAPTTMRETGAHAVAEVRTAGREAHRRNASRKTLPQRTSRRSEPSLPLTLVRQRGEADGQKHLGIL